MQNYRHRTGLWALLLAFLIALFMSLYALKGIAYGAEYEVIQRIYASTGTVSPADNSAYCGINYGNMVVGACSNNNIITSWATLENTCASVSLEVRAVTSSNINVTAGSSSLDVYLDNFTSIGYASPSMFLFPQGLKFNYIGIHPLGVKIFRGWSYPQYNYAFVKGARILLGIQHPTWATNPTNVNTNIALDCWATKSAGSTIDTSSFLTDADMQELTSVMEIFSVLMVFLGALYVGNRLLK